jgi:hypothetical protein
MEKKNKEESQSISSLISLFPPLAILFILINWCKGSKATALSVFSVLAAVAFSLIFYLQITDQF